MRRTLRNALQEVALLVGYAIVVFRPGALPPQHPQLAPTATSASDGWSPEERQLYISEARRDMDQQQADKRDVRARAQQVFTTTLVLGAAIGASYSRTAHGSVGTAVYLLAAGLTALAGFAAAGVITAKSLIGAPSLSNLIDTSAGKVEEQLVREYAATRHVGAATVAVLVTVMRDAVLVLILAFIAFACAYLWG
ncbi:hypothetical protein EV651_10121 [Kribbella sp. VKM Ac-2571]|uniref:hypothetical protein n=1 Tax=Kribbella sp. VKM Ac-2571 TaxID=2512222 RepID=UPI0010D27D19|nr:hypothetical protein [Kribbella sp. VKM Ac-2571]TDO68987.1 hypothetical protein EV651_10121 [Kribbella sp. VKM Ac-2571]